ncbi:unnamed protein product [Jaminaea pallidilutea]
MTQLNGGSSAATPQRRHTWSPFLALGIVANAVPFVLQVRHGGKDADRPDVNIVSSLGNCWSIWAAESLVQVFVGSRLPQKVSQLALSTSPDSILAAAGAAVYRSVRGRIVATYEAPNPIAHMAAFGDSLLVIDTQSSLHHFSLSTKDLLTSIKLPAPSAATSLLHPSTYLNKVLIGLSSGNLQLWNIQHSALLHQFDAHTLRASHGISTSASPPAILSVAQTPALDIVAITTADGNILLHDIRNDRAVMTFKLESPLSATPPTFRTDGRAHTMAVGSRTGDIFIFDLDPSDSKANTAAETDDEMDNEDKEEQDRVRCNTPRLIHTIRSGHTSPVAGLEFVPGQPLLISSAADNAIKQWFFEPSTNDTSFNGTSASSSAAQSSSSLSLPRLLKSREGHSEPPSLVRWYGEDGRAPLLSAGRDRSVRLGWIGREARGGELSQGSIVRKANQLSLPPQNLKLPPATTVAFSLTRSRDWDDILTIHPSSLPRTWFGRDRRLNAQALRQPSSKKQGGSPSTASTAAVSHCGNFALVGNSNGTVHIFNMQSGRFVRAFDTRSTPSTASAKSASCNVVGVVADEGNRELVAVTASGVVHIFDFHTTTLLSSQRFHAFAGIRPSPHTTMLALIPLGLSNPLLLFDVQTRRIVRRFKDLPGRITDVAFSPSLRSLLVATMDGNLTTYDIPSGLAMDRIRLREVMVSVDWSPDGSMLAACGTEGKGIYLWSWTGGRGLLADDSDDAVEMESVDAALPSVRGFGADTEEEPEALEEPMATTLSLDGLKDYGISAIPLLNGEANGEAEPLTTLTTQPRTKWTTLLNLDVIKARDRPRTVTKPKRKHDTPFFLGASSAAPKSAVGQADGVGAHINGGTLASGRQASGDEGTRSTLMEQMARDELQRSDESTLQRLLRIGAANDDGDFDFLFDHLFHLSPPQLDLALRLELASLPDMTAFLRACARRVSRARDFEGVTVLVETLRKVRGDEMLTALPEANGAGEESGHIDDDDEDQRERDELRAAWSEWLAAVQQANDRVGDLLDYTLGTLSFLRGVPVV